MTSNTPGISSRSDVSQANGAAAPSNDDPATSQADDASVDSATTFPIVGVGASAGGLQPLTQLLNALPYDTGMGFVIIQHLAADHVSSLSEILSRATRMPVSEVREETTVRPDHVYVIPPGADLAIFEGMLRLVPRERESERRGIDQFFSSLAQDCGHKSIGVVLSGALTDGTLGLEAIKSAGGVTFAQNDSAQHNSMPRSAVASGCVDFVLAPDQIATEIARIARHPYVAPESGKAADHQPSRVRIIQILHRATGVDFSNYKPNMLERRITRRIMLRKLAELKDYETHLQRAPDEVEALFQDILIGVTSFFRDSDAFDVLSNTVFPRLDSEALPSTAITHVGARMLDRRRSVFVGDGIYRMCRSGQQRCAVTDLRHRPE